MNQELKSPIESHDKSVQNISWTIWPSLDIPGLILDSGFITLVLLEFNQFPTINLADLHDTISGNYLMVSIAACLHICLGYLAGQLYFAWRSVFGKTIVSSLKTDESLLGIYFKIYFSWIFLPCQAFGLLLLIPIYFDAFAIASIASALIGMPFGFFYAQELESQTRSTSPSISVARDNIAEYLPLYPFVFIWIIPLERDYKLESQASIFFLAWLVSGFLISLLGFFLLRAILSRTRTLLSPITGKLQFKRVYTSFLAVAVFLTLAVIETSFIEDMYTRQYSPKMILFLTCLFGLIPFRLLSIITPPFSPINMIVTMTGLAIFVAKINSQL